MSIEQITLDLKELLVLMLLIELLTDWLRGNELMITTDMSIRLKTQNKTSCRLVAWIR